MALVRDSNTPQGDRIPPQSVELEMCVLGGVMLEPKEAFPIVADFLTRDSFYLDGHGLIFTVMGELHARGIPPDSIAVLDELRSRQLLDKVGGSGVVLSMLNSVPTAANVEHHARKVSEKSQLRRLIHECTRVVEEAYKQEQSLEHILDFAERTVLGLTMHNTAHEFSTISEVLRSYWDKFEARETELKERRARGEVDPQLTTGLESGFLDLDYVTGGLRDSELTIIAARPSVGKTALALNFAHNIAVKNNVPIAIFSLEMGGEQLAERLLCVGTQHTDPQTRVVSGIATNRLHNPDFNDREWNVLTESYHRLMTAPIFLDDSSFLTVNMLKSKARRLAAKHNVGAIIVDYLQLMSGYSGTDNRVQEVSEISRGLKQIARELHIPVLALSQLSRQVEARHNKKPHLSDLRESGAIEQDADVVIFIHRDDYYGEGKENENPMTSLGTRLSAVDLIVAKNRNGPTDTVKMLWFKEITRFLDKTGR